MIFSLIKELGEHPLFVGVPSEHVRKYLGEDSMTVKKFPADTTAYSSKSEKTQVAFVLSGTARVYVGTGEEKALMRTLRAGDVFGVANLYDTKAPFPTHVITASDTEILFIDGDAFKRYIENDTVATKNYICFLSKKIVFLNKKLATLTAGSAEKKLAAYICEHKTEDTFISPSLSELANVLRMGRASLYRAVDTLTNEGLIVKNGKRFTILNEEKLKNL